MSLKSLTNNPSFVRTVQKGKLTRDGKTKKKIINQTNEERATQL